MTKCHFSNEISPDVFICSKYGDYCLLDRPDHKQCIKLFGDDEPLSDLINEAEFDEEYNTDESVE